MGAGAAEQASVAHWHNALVTQNQSVEQRIAGELGVAVRQFSAAVDLLDVGATVPFIARYRKEATGTLDDTQLRTLEDTKSWPARRRDSTMVAETSQR